MIRSDHKLFGHMSRDAVQFQGSVRGAGAAPPTITPITFPVPNTTQIQYMAASDNFILSTARSGVGAYTFTLKDTVPVLYDCDVNVWGLDGKQAQVADFNPTTKVLTVTVLTNAGAAVDLATTDNLRFTFVGNLNVPVY